MKYALAIVSMLVTGMTLPQSHAADCPNNSTANPTILEVVSFKLAPGVSEEEFVSIVEQMEQSFLCNTKGFVSRVLAKDEEGNWLDQVKWQSLPDAMNAMEASMKEVSVAPFLQAIDPNSIQAKHWNIAVHTQ